VSAFTDEGEGNPQNEDGFGVWHVLKRKGDKELDAQHDVVAYFEAYFVLNNSPGKLCDS